MRTVLLFLFLACLSLLMCCVEATRWLLARTCPALLERWPVPPHPARHKPGLPASFAAAN